MITDNKLYSHKKAAVNLQEAAAWIKTNLSQEVAANTLRKACASGRLKGIRKGEGSMHIRRTEWDVREEDITAFMRGEYHPRPSRRGKMINSIHIPNNSNSKITSGTINTNNRVSVFYRVVEHLYQNTLPMHGERMEKYDTRIVETKIRSKVKAEETVQKLKEAAQISNLSDQLQYAVETYIIPKKVK